MKNVLILLLVLLAIAAAYVAMQPSEFLVVRTRTLAAPPEIVFAHVNDFRKWVDWSPWEKLDPALQREYSGAPAGPGAMYHWVGNEQVGEGRMTITDSRAPDSVTILLEFLKPFQATNTAQFDIVKGGLGTDVTWSMAGHNNFMAKAFSLFMNMDKMVGGDFEKGLAALDGVTAEAAAAAAAAAPPPAPEAPAPEEGAAPEAAAPEAPAAEAAPPTP